MGALQFVIYSKQSNVDIEFTKSLMNMKSRGPDDTHYGIESMVNITRNNEDQIKLHLSRREIAEYTPYTFISAYHRNCINDLTKDGSQPFEDPIIHKIKKYPELRTRVKRKLYCNGEIYNYNDIVTSEQYTDKDLQSTSDVEVIMPLYIQYGIEKTLEKLNGDFSFILTENLQTFDIKSLNVFVARDVLGARSLYMIKKKNPSLGVFYMFTSELKGIPKHLMDNENYSVCEVPPGSYWSFQNSIVDNNTDEFISYVNWDVYKPIQCCTVTSTSPDVLTNVYNNIKTKMSQAVARRYDLSDVPVGVLVSGGFDSSIVLSLVASMNHAKPIYAFTIGKLDSEDVLCATTVVEFLENKYGIDIHHHVVSTDNTSFTQGQMSELVYMLETYDPNTIKSALPMLQLFNYIQNHTPVKVLLTGDGLDKMCGQADCDEELQSNCVTLVKNLHAFELKKYDKLAGSFGLEVRYPLLDVDFVEYMLKIHPRLKRPQVYSHGEAPIKKYIVRKAFDTGSESQMLPYDILYRRSSKTIAKLDNAFYEDIYTDTQICDFMNKQHIRTDEITRPVTTEQIHLRDLFEKMFGDKHRIPLYSDNI